MAKKKTAAKKKASTKKTTSKVKQRSKKTPATRRLAIHAMCRECIYDPTEPGGWRGQVEACTATDCPLYKFRPMTIASERAKTTARKKVKQ